MKSTNRKVLIFALLATTAALGLTLLATSHVTAQGPEIKFKVGDHVEVDTLYSSTKPEESMFWRAGTIIKIVDPENRFGHYVIKLDKDGHEMVFASLIRNGFVRLKTLTTSPPIKTNSRRKEMPRRRMLRPLPALPPMILRVNRNRPSSSVSSPSAT